MYGMSEAAYSGSGGCDELVTQLYHKLATEAKIVSIDHIKAIETLCTLQPLLQSLEQASKRSQIRLVCIVTSLLRRLTRLREEIAHALYVAESVNSKYVDQLRGACSAFECTLALVFVAIATMDVAALGGTPADAESSMDALDAALKRCLWDELCRHSKRRLEVPEEVQENERQRLLVEALAERPYQSCEDSSGWTRVIAQPGNLANSSVRSAGAMLATAMNDDFEQIKRLSRLFAESTIEQMAVGMLKSDDDFLTLSTRRLNQLSEKDRADAVSAVIGAAESEAGQCVLRDLVMSFLLPRSVIGKRRTLLLPREVSDHSSRQYPWIASIAHSCAMQGSEYLWKNSRSELFKTCSLLAGVAMLTTPANTDDLVRKSTAFGGRVQLPFLDTIPPPLRSMTRMALVPATRSWCLYSLSKDGRPLVGICQRGFEGLVSTVLCFKDKI